MEEGRIGLPLCIERHRGFLKIKEATAKAGIGALRHFLCGIGMLKNFEELGAKEEDCEKIYKLMV